MTWNSEGEIKYATEQQSFLEIWFAFASIGIGKDDETFLLTQKRTSFPATLLFTIFFFFNLTLLYYRDIYVLSHSELLGMTSCVEHSSVKALKQLNIFQPLFRNLFLYKS